MAELPNYEELINLVVEDALPVGLGDSAERLTLLDILHTPASQDVLRRCFTDVSLDRLNNYEALELIGDKMLSGALFDILSRAPGRTLNGTTLTEQILTELNASLMGKYYQTILFTEYNLARYLMVNPSLGFRPQDITDQKYSDLVESLMGGLYHILEGHATLTPVTVITNILIARLAKLRDYPRERYYGAFFTQLDQYLGRRVRRAGDFSSKNEEDLRFFEPAKVPDGERNEYLNRIVDENERRRAELVFNQPQKHYRLGVIDRYAVFHQQRSCDDLNASAGRFTRFGIDRVPDRLEAKLYVGTGRDPVENAYQQIFYDLLDAGFSRKWMLLHRAWKNFERIAARAHNSQLTSLLRDSGTYPNVGEVDKFNYEGGQPYRVRAINIIATSTATDVVFMDDSYYRIRTHDNDEPGGDEKARQITVLEMFAREHGRELDDAKAFSGPGASV